MLTHEVFVVPFSFLKKIGASFLDDVYSGCFYGLAKGLLISKENFGTYLQIFPKTNQIFEGFDVIVIFSI